MANGRIIFLIMMLTPAAWAQAPVISSVTTDVPGVTAIGPGTEIYIIGTFVPQSAGRDYTITVGGQTSGINVADAGTYISGRTVFGLLARASPGLGAIE